MIEISGQPYHAVAEALTIMDSVLMNKWTKTLTVSVGNSPLPPSIDEQIQDQNSSQWIGFWVAVSASAGQG